jgi:hypothetical protein
VTDADIVRDFFGDPSAVVTGGDYFFAYQDGAYVQTASSIYGDITPSAAVTPYGLHQTAYPASADFAWGGADAGYSFSLWLEHGNDGKYVLRNTVITAHDSAAGLKADTGYCWDVAGIENTVTSSLSKISCFTTKR